jgi:hypothetical protein
MKSYKSELSNFFNIKKIVIIIIIIIPIDLIQKH